VSVDFRRDVYCLLGLPFDAVDQSAAIESIRLAAARRTPFFISTPNLNWLVGCLVDSGFRDSVVESDLSLADGMSILWVARLLKIPIRERVAGSDWFDKLRAETSAPLSVYLFGGTDGVAEAASKRLNTERGGLVCVGYENPGIGSADELSRREFIGRINASNAHILVVSLGAQKGQAWIVRNRARISVPVISHLGAVLGFVAGTIQRAPVWVRKSGLEWLWRIKEEFGLWRRYMGDGLAFLSLIATRVFPYALYLARNRVDERQLAAARIELIEQGPFCIVRLKGPWIRQNVGPLRDCFSSVAKLGKSVRLEVENVTDVDSAFIALVMLLRSHQTRHGLGFRIVSPPARVRRVIRFCCADFLYLDNANASLRNA